MWYVIQHDQYYDDLERSRYPLAVSMADDASVGEFGDDLESRGYTVVQRFMSGLCLWVKVDSDRDGTIINLLAGKYNCSVAGVYTNAMINVDPFDPEDK